MGDAARKLDQKIAGETRSAPRAAVYVNIDVFSDHNFWSGLTMNMSEGGLFIATHNVAPVGTMLVLNMVLPFEEDPIVALAEVRWTRPFNGNNDVPPGLGLQFVDLDPIALAKVRRFVKTIREPLFFEE